MAMPTGNVVITDKMQFPSVGAGAVGAGGGNGGEIHHHHQRQWFPDERDGYILWLKSEFAAANAIIDLLCQHLRAVGEPGEYDGVIGSVQQRRCNWISVLHMQQHFPVDEVTYALHQVAWRRQQRYFDPVKTGPKEYRRSGYGFKHGQRGETNLKEGHNSVPEYNGNFSGVAGERCSQKLEGIKSGGEGRSDDNVVAVADEKRAEAVAKSPANGGLKSSGCSEVATCGKSKVEEDTHSIQNHNRKQDLALTPKTFVGKEMFDGKMVNVVEGLKLYEELLEEKEVSKLVSLVNELRAAGRKGQLQGQSYVVSKRPMKGHGREMIQLGLQIADSPPEDEQGAETSKDGIVESIPSLLQDVVEGLVGSQVMSVKPDSCIIDFYNEHDHSQPNMWPSWFGRPVSMLFLTECDMTFGRNIGSDHPGDFRGPLKLSLAPGSLVVMQGKSTDLAKHAIPASRKQRILVTFTKSQPKKSLPGERLPSSTAPHWGPPPSRSPGYSRHPRHYAATTTGVSPAPQISSSNGMQPLLVAPFPPPLPIATGSSTVSWVAAPPTPRPRLPVPGTGVFLPPAGSATLSTNGGVDNGSGESNHNMTTPKGKFEDKGEMQECNGAAVGVAKEELQQDTDDSGSKA